MKKLVTANNIREAHADGKSFIDVDLKKTIVTPEAYVVAEQLKISLRDLSACSQEQVDKIVVNGGVQPSAEHKKIRECIVAQLKGKNVDEKIVAALIDKAIKENIVKNKKIEKDSGKNGGLKSLLESKQSYKSFVSKNGIKVVDSSTVKLEKFEGSKSHLVGIADLITAQDNSSMAAGFMQWENAFFPWTLNYDEIDLVLEGELHVRQGNELVVAKAGDVMFIPKGSSIEFGTPSSVRFLYVAWPANWQEC